MIFYAVDGVLLTALVMTSCLVALMYRELKRQGDHRREHAQALAQAAAALAGIDKAVQDIHSTGSEVLAALGARVSEAREVLTEIRALNGASQSHSPRGGVAPERKSPTHPALTLKRTGKTH